MDGKLILLYNINTCQYRINDENRHLGILLVLAGVITIFVKHESAWIISAILIGGGTGIFFWKDKVESEEDK